MKNKYVIFLKTKNITTIQPNNYIPGHLSREMNTYVHEYSQKCKFLCKNVYSNSIIKAPNWKLSKMLSVGTVKHAAVYL